MRKRHSVREKYRRLFTCVLWVTRFVTTFISSIPCRSLQYLHSILVCHLSVEVDIVATTEAIVAVVALLICEGWTKVDFIFLVVGLGGCMFSLSSSVGGLGEVRGGLVKIGD
jgi:hypothetical protein